MTLSDQTRFIASSTSLRRPASCFLSFGRDAPRFFFMLHVLWFCRSFADSILTQTLRSLGQRSQSTGVALDASQDSEPFPQDVLRYDRIRVKDPLNFG